MEISTGLLLEILKNVRTWLSNLHRAGNHRKNQSIQSLRAVIIAARETAVYVRHLKATGNSHQDTEAYLAKLWTNLGFVLADIGIDKLAKRCQISGKHWADPHYYTADFLEKADISLEKMEKLANEILQQIQN